LQSLLIYRVVPVHADSIIPGPNFLLPICPKNYNQSSKIKSTTNLLREVDRTRIMPKTSLLANPDDDNFVGNLRIRMPSQSSSVFDRLSSTPTKASAARDDEERKIRQEKAAKASAEMAITPPRTAPINTALNHNTPLTTPKRTARQIDQFYEKIYKQDTAASKVHHHAVERHATGSTTKTKQTDDVEEAKLALYIKPKSSEVVEVDLSLYSNIRKSISNYYNNKLSARSCALDILEALWKRDYTCKAGEDRMWKVYPGTCEEDRDIEGMWNGEELHGLLVSL